MTTVEPTLTITRPAFRGQVGTYSARDFTVTSVELDENVNEYDEPLHVVHAVDEFGGHAWWFETSDSLKALLDDALGND